MVTTDSFSYKKSGENSIIPLDAMNENAIYNSVLRLQQTLFTVRCNKHFLQ